MTLITKKSFLDIFNVKKDIELYIGMGNPDAKIHFVGCETKDEGDNDIINREIRQNYSHWQDIVHNYNHLTNAFDPILLNRTNPLDGFNPFSPLLYAPTLAIVNRNFGGRTYAGMERMIRKITGEDLRARETEDYSKSMFSKIFISELNHVPARNYNESNFDLDTYLSNKDYDPLSDFYKSFDTTILYCGKNKKYVGSTNSEQREQLVSIYLSGTISHQVINDMEVYYNSNGQKLILTRHFSSGFGEEIAQTIANINKTNL